MAKFTRVSSIDASKFGECIAYVAANRFQLDDDRPYLWKTTDCGAHWTRIDNGISSTEFTRVLREDPGKRGLLVAGTERGVWYSADDGAHWQTLRLNLPIVPVHDLTFKQGDVVVATHGRGFYIMDDISTLEQMSDAIAAKPRAPLQAARSVRGSRRAAGSAASVAVAAAPARRSRRKTRRSVRLAQNPPTGVTVQYWLKDGGEDVGLDFLDAAGKVIRSYIEQAGLGGAPVRSRRRRRLRLHATARRASRTRRA